MHPDPTMSQQEALLPPASLRAELRRQRKAIWHMGCQQDKLLDVMATFTKLISTDDEILLRLGKLASSLEAHRHLDAMNGYHSHGMSHALRSAMQGIKKEGDAARHEPFDQHRKSPTRPIAAAYLGKVAVLAGSPTSSSQLESSETITGCY